MTQKERIIQTIRLVLSPPAILISVTINCHRGKHFLNSAEQMSLTKLTNHFKIPIVLCFLSLFLSCKATIKVHKVVCEDSESSRLWLFSRKVECRITGLGVGLLKMFCCSSKGLLWFGLTCGKSQVFYFLWSPYQDCWYPWFSGASGCGNKFKLLESPEAEQNNYC